MAILDGFRKKRPEGSVSRMESRTPLVNRPSTGLYQVGDKIEGRYEIHKVLGGPGKSGMGIVYVCYDSEGGESLALKTLQDRFASEQGALDRFKWEAETWIRLEKHYNIVRALLVKVIDHKPYILMEYVAGDPRYGPDLSGWIRGGGLRRNDRPNIDLVLDFSLQFCHGMTHAKRKFGEMGKPFVHRDVKPSNILVTNDRVVKVTDFGLVKAFAESREESISIMVEAEGYQKLGLSKAGGICGTPPYMSPEQCVGEDQIDERSDIYSFGCVLYEMLTGRHVFEASAPKDFIRHHLKSVPLSPNAYGALDSVVMKCLEKDQLRRYQTFQELERELAKLCLRLTGKLAEPPRGGLLEAWEISNKGFSLWHLGYSEEAEGCFRDALKINPNLAQVHNN